MIRQDFSYELPKNLIAQTPLPNREESRLMVIDKKTGEYGHKVFRDITDYINKGDCLVINNTKVIPARLIGENGSSKVEFLLLNKTGMKDHWEVLVKPGKKAKPGDRIVFGEGILTGSILSIGDGGKREVLFEYSDASVFEEILDMLGEMPLPPYITQKLDDKNRYQTVYAKHEGSAAAPTAGLHFTEELLDRLQRKGVIIANITLHVGLGTFRPVKTDDITEHEMHSEYYNIDAQESAKINEAKRLGGKIIAVGTTSCRTLESCAKNGYLEPGNGYTDIFIYPGYEFKIVDSLITNFHLPESTLIMLVSALCGRDEILRAYDEAVKQEYRFFSFGDAMFIKG